MVMNVLAPELSFEEWAELPENADKVFECIAGEVVEVPSNPFASKISGIIFGELYLFLRGKNLGHLTGEAGGYVVYGEHYAPDVAYISKARQPELARSGYNPNPPDLAVEVDFPSTMQSQRTLRIKLGNYLAVGTTVWVVFPEEKLVEIYTPGQAVQTLGVDGMISGGDVLSGFTLAVKDIFPEDGK